MAGISRKLKDVILKAYDYVTSKREEYDCNRLYQMLDSWDSHFIYNVFPSKPISSVVFVIPGIGTHEGGITSILRLGVFISKEGYEVSYLSYSDQSKSDMELLARKNINEFNSKIYSWNERNRVNADVLIATNWRSVYYSANLSGYKMYFVQDYEPYFYPKGDYELLARITYELGYHIVSLGSWNIEHIKKHKNRNFIFDCIDFPYEPSEYKLKTRNFNRLKDKNVL